MKVVIIEDEDLAVEGLILQLERLHLGCEVVATLDSVHAAVQWFGSNPAPDLAFFDIQIADGLSFEIFERVTVACPVIFTTAYDAYALRAFKVNSIDYLLKPVEINDLQRAIEKWKSLKTSPAILTTAPSFDLEMIRQILHRSTPNFKTRFMVKVGDRLAAFTTEEIEYFFGENKIVWMRLKNGRKYIVDYTLEDLEDLLEPQSFYRMNRKYIVTFSAIKDVIAYSNSRLKVVLKEAPDTEDILISREKAETFRIWYGK